MREQWVEQMKRLTEIIQENPKVARRFIKTRIQLGKTLVVAGDKYKRVLDRPKSIVPDYVPHIEPPKPREQVGDILADNLKPSDEAPKKRGRKPAVSE